MWAMPARQPEVWKRFAAAQRARQRVLNKQRVFYLERESERSSASESVPTHYDQAAEAERRQALAAADGRKRAFRMTPEQKLQQDIAELDRALGVYVGPPQHLRIKGSRLRPFRSRVALAAEEVKSRRERQRQAQDVV